MDTETLSKLQLIKRDVRDIKKYIFEDNDLNNWCKLIIVYNFYLFYSHMYILQQIAIYMMDSKNSFSDDFKKIYMFFFILCNLRSTYLYFILNVGKIDYNLSMRFYKNTKEYFI
jgi:hypothetical protein